MSARDKHYKPRRFREETEDTAERKLKYSRSAEKYMVNPNEEYASEPGSENSGVHRPVRFPSKVNVPVEEPVSRPVYKKRNNAVTDNQRKAMAVVEELSAEQPKPEMTENVSKSGEPSIEAPELAAEAAAATAAAETVENIVNAEKADTSVFEEDKPEAQTPAKVEEQAKAEPETEPEKEPQTQAAAGSEEAENADKAAEDKQVDEDLDYVMPYHHKHRGHHHSHHSSHHDRDGIADDDEVQWNDNPDDYVQALPKPKRKKSRASKALIAILCVILAVVVGSVSTFFIMREVGRKKMHNYDKIEINAPAKDESGNAIDTIDATGRVIKYDGVSYAFNENVISITFIGTDEGKDKNAGKQMGDAIYVLAVDTKTGSTKILGISRDTMSDVDVYSDEGNFIDTEKLQMAYAYSFTGTNVTGGQNTLTSISRLFYGLPLNDYFAINLDALTTLNDAIGGVTLTSSMTFVSPEDGRTIYEGETVTLHGAEAERYVRSRDTEQLESNNDRMARQQEYIRAFIASIFPAAKKDISVVSNLYGAIKDNSDSSLDITKLTYIASTALSHLKNASDIEYINLTGKIVEGKNAELYVSNEDAIRTMLNVFYTPMAGTNVE